MTKNHYCSQRCPKGTWKVGSGRHGVTHFREMCRRRPFGWKCVRRRMEGCATERPGRQVRRRAELRTSGKCAIEGRLGGSALKGGWRNAPWRGLGGHFVAARRYALPQNVPQKAFRAEVRNKPRGGMRAPGTRQDRITAFSVLAGDFGSPQGPNLHNSCPLE